MARYAGVSNFVGWQTAQAATWQQRVPGPDADRQRAGGVLAAGPAGRGGGAAGGAGVRHGPVPVVAARPRGADRPVPQRHSARVAGGVRPLRLVRRAVPGAAQPRGRRGGGPGGGRAGSDPAAGGPALGPGRPRRHRSAARCPDGRPARAGAGRGRPATARPRSSGTGRRVRRATTRSSAPGRRSGWRTGLHRHSKRGVKGWRRRG